ncbi:hypothetical protein [Flavobacterium sp.]|uniref:hypothetical protein n=1 Tax=Flavobacterium sp. TaxID=239 RepID=UPI003263F66C
MDTETKEILWKQFGGTIDMLESAIVVCPDHFWVKNNFWYAVYHAIFYLDYYSSKEPDSFVPPEPFTLSEFDPTGILPERVYSKEEIIRIS